MLLSRGRGAVRVGAVLAAVVSVSPCASAGDSVVLQVVALSLNNRASIVISMADLVAEVFEATSDDPATVIVEAGPLDADPRAQILTSNPALPCIADVSLRGFAREGDRFLRVRVRLRAPCRHAVRVVGQRLYVDAIPLSDRERKSAASGPTAPRGGRALPQGTPAPASPSPDPANPEDVAHAYQSLESTVPSRARALAARPDVKALEALLTEVDRRDEQLGRQRPDLVVPLRTEVEQRLAEARALRLKLDGIAFRQGTGRENRQK